MDRLLASPHYGERWGRHWLDVVRYAETTANDANAVMRYAYRYRNYVIDAFNKRQALRSVPRSSSWPAICCPRPAIETRRAERVIATGFLMIGPKALAETDKEQTRLDVVDDQIDVTGRALLGLTLGCARCHDHKFDPIPTQDYYALAGIFRSTEVFRDEVRNASMWQEWELPQAPGKDAVVVMAPQEGSRRTCACTSGATGLARRRCPAWLSPDPGAVRSRSPCRTGKAAGWSWPAGLPASTTR